MKEVILKAKSSGNNIVVAGDSGGGFVAQHAHLKYGVDAFCTNTTGIYSLDARTDKQLRDPNLYNPNGKMFSVYLRVDSFFIKKYPARWLGKIYLMKETIIKLFIFDQYANKLFLYFYCQVL